MATAKIESDNMISDARLHQALAIVESEQIAVLSLDVFDTLLWRTVPEPTDAFFLLGKRLLKERLLRPSISPEVFAKLRMLAEGEARKKARSRRGFPEVTLAEIYEAFPAKALTGSKEQALSLELQLEKEITVPDLNVVAFINKVQAQHKVPVILVSDTYFSRAEISDLICREGIPAFEFDKIFVSSEHMVGKGKGLFRIVLKSMGVDANKVLHVGDNKDADVKMPKKLGVKTIFYRKYSEYLIGLIEAEIAQPPSHHKLIDGRVHIDAGDGGVAALRSRVLARPERWLLPEDLEPYWSFGATVLGPAFTGFAEWVLRRAEEEGVDQVYCLMREGDFLSELFNNAQSYLRSPVAARQLWLSRLLCARASIFKGDAKELRSFWRRRRPPTLVELCKTLGISPQQVTGFQDYTHLPIANKKRVKQLIKELTTSPEIKKQIVQNSADLRERLFAYIDKVREEEVEKGDRIVIADLGWGLSTQGELEKVIQGAEVNLNLLGLYLLTAEGANLRMLEGIDAEGFLSNCGIPKRSEWVVRSPEVLEQLCMPEAGSVVDISLNGKPQLAAFKGDKVRAAQKQAVRDGILAFQAEWARYVEAFPSLQGCLSSSVQPLLLNHLTRFVARPTPEEASLFCDWCHEDNYGSDSEGKLIPDGLSNIINHATPAVFDRMVQQTDIYWPSGLLTLHDPGAAEAFAAVVDNRVSPEAFINVEDIWVESYFDKGDGFRAKEGIYSKLIFNKYGLSFFEGTFYESGIEAVRFDPCGFPALLRINWVKLTLWQKGRVEPKVLYLETPKDLSRLEYHEIVPWDGNLVICTGSDPWFACRFNRFGELPAETVNIQVGFAIFPYAVPTSEIIKKHAGNQAVKAARRLAGRARRLERSLRRRLFD